MRRLLLLLALVLPLAVVAEAQAETVALEDREGRPITFDVRAEGTDPEWFANLLRDAAHGDEISGVTVRLVPASELRSTCGAEAGGCYRHGRSEGLIIVPAERTAQTAHTLIHEYGHHLDGSRSVPGVSEPNGTPAWWQAREMERRLEAGRVAFDYSLGWSRSVGEIFAEDYTQLNLQSFYKIGWLSPPGRTVLDALRADLDGGPATPAPTPAGDPLVLVRRGTLAPGERRSLPFRLLGPGRRVTFTARVANSGTPRVRALAELVCGRTRIVRTLRPARPSATIDRAGLGPASCEAALANPSSSPQSYTVRLRLAIAP